MIFILTDICLRLNLQDLGFLLFFHLSHMLPLGMTCTCHHTPCSFYILLCLSILFVSRSCFKNTLFQHTHTIQSPPNQGPRCFVWWLFFLLNRHGHTKQTLSLHQKTTDVTLVYLLIVLCFTVADSLNYQVWFGSVLNSRLILRSTFDQIDTLESVC